MSWAKWDAEHRSAGVRVADVGGGRSKVTSGGKHLGNIEKQGNLYKAVTKVNGNLQSHTALTHQGALNHIRAVHGLPAVSSKKAAAPQVPHVPGMGLASPKKTAAKKTAAAAPKTAAAARDAMHAPAPAKKTAAPFHAWNAEHGSGGGGVSSADQIAASIRGALGPGKMDAPKMTSKTGKSGSTISRAAESRSTAAHVLKKDMKRPAPVKGEKDPADAFRTKIRMAAYNEKKKQAVAADPVNAHTPHTEEALNPHDMSPTDKAEAYMKARKAANAAGSKAMQENTVAAHQAAYDAHNKAMGLATSYGIKKGHRGNMELHAKQIQKLGGTVNSGKGTPAVKKTAASSSADKIAAAIKGAHAEQHGKVVPSAPAVKKAAAPKAEAPKVAHTVPALVENKHAEGSVEDLANKADAATHAANASPSYVNHQKAYQAHAAVLSKLGSTSHSGSDQYKARDYHTMMQGYHRFAADHPSQVIPAGVKEEHTDKLADRIPQASAHQMFTSFTESNSRRHSQQLYTALPRASEAKLTAAEKSSIGAYSSSGYGTINAHHRNPGKLSATDKAYAEKHTANLDSAFRKQPALEHDLVTYRGTREADKLFGKVGEKVGGEFVDHGYTSTATHAAVGGGFGGGMAGSNTNTLVRILHPQGSKVMKLSDTSSFGDSEREVLTPRGTRFHIAADRIVTLQNGRTQRQVDLVRK